MAQPSVRFQTPLRRYASGGIQQTPSVAFANASQIPFAPQIAEPTVYTGYNLGEGDPRVGYVDPASNILAGLNLAPGNGLPAVYDSLPSVGRPSRLYELPKYHDYSKDPALTQEQIASANRYAAAIAPAKSQYIAAVPRDSPLTRAQKEKNKADAKKRRLQELAKAFGDNPMEQINAQAAYRRIQKEKAQAERLRKWNEQWGGAEGYQKLQQSLALKNVARKLPASITNANYFDSLRAGTIRGQSRTAMPEYLQNAMVPYEGWIGRTPQTMSAEERHKAMMAFAALVGVLNVQPKFDARLLSVESAKQIYNDEDYNVVAYDLDDNVLTPGTVIITTKFDTTDFDGNYIPAGQIIAIGGYKLANPSGSASEARMKKMMYYSQNPKRKDRKNVTFKDWMNADEQAGLRKPKSAPKGMRIVTEHIRSILETLSYGLMPTRMRVGDKYIERPAFMAFASRGSGESENLTIIVCYRVSSIVMNTIISRVAELYFNLLVAPLLYQQLTKSPEFATTTTTASSAAASEENVADVLEEFVRACEENVSFKIGADVYNLNLKQPVVAIAPTAKLSLGQIIAFGWRASYFHPSALTKFLSHPVLKQYIESAVNDITKEMGADKESEFVSFIMNIVLMHTMNSNFETYLDELMKKVITSEQLPEALNWCIDHTIFIFAPPDIITGNLIPKLQDYEKANDIITLTSRAWDKDVRIRYKISERGARKLPPVIRDRYLGMSIDAANPALYASLGSAAAATPKVNRSSLYEADAMKTPATPDMDIKEEENPLVNGIGIGAGSSSSE